MGNKKYTIKDIAQLAGVSKGTVDRVLHNRGKVSQKALKAINKVLSEIDYQPNLLARNLKNNKSHTICALIPNPKKDNYWQSCVEGIDKAIKELKHFNISIEIHFFNPTNTASFRKKSKTIIDLKPDAVLLTPLFYKQSMDIIKEYYTKNILVSIFNGHIDSKFVKNYVGQDLYKSGRVAAKLMQSITPKNASLIIINIEESVNNANHIQQKEKGFRSFFKGLVNKDQYNITTLNIENSGFENMLANYLVKNPRIDGIFITTSKSYKVVKVLSKVKNEPPKVIGYDLLDENVAFLKEQKIDFLIDQNPKQQTYLNVVFLAEHFLFNKSIPKEKLLSIDIVNSENVDSYLAL